MKKVYSSLKNNQNQSTEFVLEKVSSFPAGAKIGRVLYHTGLGSAFTCENETGDTTQADHWSSAEGVLSFNGREGNVIPEAGDYSANQIDTNETGVNVQNKLDSLDAGLQIEIQDRIDADDALHTEITNLTAEQIATNETGINTQDKLDSLDAGLQIEIQDRVLADINLQNQINNIENNLTASGIATDETGVSIQDKLNELGSTDIILENEIIQLQNDIGSLTASQISTNQTGQSVQNELDNLNSGLASEIITRQSNVDALQDEIDSLAASNLPTNETGVSIQDKLDSLDLTDAGLQSQINNISNNLTASQISTNETGVSIQDALDSKANGGAFITNIVPTGSGNVGTKVYTVDNVQLLSCVSDTQLVTVSVLGITGNTHYTPVMILHWGTHSQAVTMVARADKPLFDGSAAIDLQGETELVIIHEDGAQQSCTVTVDAPPQIQSANFTGGYPGSQTELKLSDTFQINVISDIPFVAIELADYGAYSYQTFSFSPVTNKTVTGVIANRGTSVQSLGAKIRVQKSTGSWSTYHLTENDGSVDGVNLVKLNNMYPSVVIGVITYPGAQQALKNSESATVSNSLSNYNTVLYDSPNGDISIANNTTVETLKSVTRIAGSYNIATNNFRITATRTANNAVTISQTVVKIANVSATLTVTEPATRLRSGGNDGTANQSYVITATASQNLLSAPIIGIGGQGTWLGVGFAGSGTTWTRSMEVTDSMTKGSYTYGAVSCFNLAGIETTAITGDNTYTLGGFVSRVITLAAYANEAQFNVAVVDYTKLTLSWNVKSLTIKSPVGTNVPPPITDAWCIDSLSINPTTARVLDLSACLASSVPSFLTIQESV